VNGEPEPTEEEQDEGPERRRAEDAMRGQGHDDPEQAPAPADDE
jgi:hypothetical protein